MSYGVPKDNTDATARAGRLAPSLNALSDAVDDLDEKQKAQGERLKTNEALASTTANKVTKLEEKDTVTSQQLTAALNPLISADSNHDSHLGQVDKRIATLEAAQVASGTNVAPGSSLVPPAPTPSPEMPELSNPVLTPDGWAEGATGGGGVTAAVVEAYDGVARTGTASYTKDGTLTTGPFVRASSETPGVGDEIALGLNLDSALTSFCLGITKYQNPYSPPVYGPFNTGVNFPIGWKDLAYTPNASNAVGYFAKPARDSSNALGFGADAFAYVTGSYTVAVFRPSTGASMMLPSAPIAIKYLHATRDGLVAISSAGLVYRYNAASLTWEQLVMPANPDNPTLYVETWVEDGTVVMFRYKYSSPTLMKVFKITITANGITEALFGPEITENAAPFIKFIQYGNGCIWIFMNSVSSTSAAETLRALSGQGVDWKTSVGTSSIKFAVHNGNPMAYYSTWVNSLTSQKTTIDGAGNFWILGMDNSEDNFMYMTKVSREGLRTTYSWIQHTQAETVTSVIGIQAVGAMVLAYGSVKIENMETHAQYSRASIWQTDGQTSSRSWSSQQYPDPEYTGSGSRYAAVVSVNLAPEGGNRVLTYYQAGIASSGNAHLITYFNEHTF